jgi:hypothetical protein
MNAPAPLFTYDTTAIDWHEFITPGTWYRILSVDVPRRQANMLVKFEANSECMYHRHAATTSTLVLQGELPVREQVDGEEVIKVKPAGSFSNGGYGEIHIEGSGYQQAVIFFGMSSDTEVIYEFMNPDLVTVKRAVTVADFDRDWRTRWPDDQRED